MEIYVDIKEIWDNTIVVDIPDDTEPNQVRDVALDAARRALEEEGEPDNAQYNRTLEDETWTVRDDEGDFF